MRRFLVPILAVALLITGYFAYTQNQLNADLTRRAEAQYQKSFHELVWGVDTINSQLAQTLVTSSPEQIMNSLTNLWRQAYGAQANLASIPVLMVELDRTEKLLSDIAHYSYYLLKVNNIEQKKLTEQEWDKLQEFYQRSMVVCNELSQIEAQVLNRNLSFVDLETRALRRGENLTNHVIVSGFTNIENKVRAFPELQFEEGVQSIEREPRPIEGEDITSEQALEIAREFLSEHDGPVANIEIMFDADGRIPIYGISGFRRGSNNPTYVEVTKKGGHIIEMYMDRPVRVSNIDIADAEERAREFLARLDLENLELVDVDSNINTAILTFVPIQDGVLLYSDMVKAQVALDDGQIISFDQTSYLAYHQDREIGEAALAAEEVTQDMNPKFNILQTRLALIPNEFETREVLTYEVRGQINEEIFLVFIDARTGEDVRVIRMTRPREYQIRMQQ